jgi:hypothetical protein
MAMVIMWPVQNIPREHQMDLLPTVLLLAFRQSAALRRIEQQESADRA